MTLQELKKQVREKFKTELELNTSLNLLHEPDRERADELCIFLNHTIDQTIAFVKERVVPEELEEKPTDAGIEKVGIRCWNETRQEMISRFDGLLTPLTSL